MFACRHARERLAKDERKRIVFHWCPFHEDVAWNQLVDEDAEQAPRTYLSNATSARLHTCIIYWRFSSNRMGKINVEV